MTQISFDTLIAASATAAGLSTDQTRAALTGALGLLDKHAEPDDMTALYQAVPDAEAIARSPEARPRSGGFLGGLIKSTGGLSGKAVADAMGLLDRLKDQGVGKDDLKRLLPVAREQVRAASGRDLLGDAVRSVPGVGPLLGAG